MKLILILTSLFIMGCINEIEVSLKSKKATKVQTGMNITNIKVVNHQFVIQGSGLSVAQSINYNDGTITVPLQIESVSSTQIIANGLSNLTIIAGKILNFVVSSADASSSFTVDFSLCSSKLGGKNIDCSVPPNDKEVLSYDATSDKWKPRAINGLNYQGTFDASSGNAPTSTYVGDYFIISASGIIGGVNFAVGDWIVLSAVGDWEKINNSSAITTVFSRTGVVVATKGDYILDKMGDVDLTTAPPVANQYLKYNGTKWVPGIVTTSSGTVTNVTATAPLAVANGTTAPTISITQATTATDGYLSSIDWNTFNNKQATIVAGTTAQYYRGDKSWQTLDTSVVPENTNLYFTNARVLAVPLAGIVVANSALTAADSILIGMGKAQGQIDAINTTLTTTSTNLTTKADLFNVAQTITAAAVTGLSLPITNSDAANKAYVDSQVSGAGHWTLSGSDVYRSSGNVGIGTNSPQFTLDVNGIVGIGSRISSSVDGANNAFWLARGSSAEVNRIGYGINADATTGVVNSVQLRTNGLTRLKVDSAGNVGIGTTTPAQKLSVAGTIESTSGGFKFPDGTTQITAAAGVLTSLLTGLSTVTNMVITASDSVIEAFGKLQAQISGIITSVSGKADLINGSQSITASNITTTTINGSPFVNGMWTTSGSDIYRLGGNIGIGTSSPTMALDVNGGIKSIFGEPTGINSNSSGFSFDGDTGMFAADDGQLNFWSNNNRTMSLFNDRVGIGTSSPASPLHVVGPIISSSGGDYTQIDQSAVRSYRANPFYVDHAMIGQAIKIRTSNATSLDTTAMTILSTGKVGLGTTAPNTNLHIAGSSDGANLNLLQLSNTAGQTIGTEVGIYFAPTNSATRGAKITAYQSGSNHIGLKFYVGHASDAATEAMHITSLGNVGIGTSVPSYKLDVQGGDINASGSVRAAGIALTSDIRYKKDIAPLDNALEKILKIQGVGYNWRSEEFPEKQFNNRHQIGVIAQEVELQFPEIVDTNKAGYKSVNYPALVAPLIEAVKSLYYKVLEISHSELDNSQKIASIELKMADKETLEFSNAKIQKLEQENTKIKVANLKMQSENIEIKSENTEIKSRLEKIEKMLKK